MSGKKSDHGDAVTLANILRTDADQHRRLPADTELAQSITVLARAHQDATWRRSRAGRRGCPSRGSWPPCAAPDANAA